MFGRGSTSSCFLLFPPSQRSEPLCSVTEDTSLTRIMWPVEMSMLDWTGSSDHDEVLLRAEGLGIGPSLNWDETLLIREVCGPSGRSGGRVTMRWRHSSCKTEGLGTESVLSSLPGSPWVVLQAVGHWPHLTHLLVLRAKVHTHEKSLSGPPGGLGTSPFSTHHQCLTQEGGTILPS
jgi:hypothetical protein